MSTKLILSIASIQEKCDVRKILNLLILRYEIVDRCLEEQMNPGLAVGPGPWPPQLREPSTSEVDSPLSALYLPLNPQFGEKNIPKVFYPIQSLDP